MDISRRGALAGIAVVVGLVAAVILQEVLGTVFVAATVAYVLGPVQRWFADRGLPPWWSASAATVTGLGVVAAVLAPLVGLLYFRFDALRNLVPSGAIPDSVTLSFAGFERTVAVASLVPAAVDYLQGVAIATARAAPVVALKATLFAMVVFALLLARGRLHTAVRGAVPPEYRDAVDRLGGRARSTLFAIYVLQAATALATFVLAVPFFFVLGYRFPFTLATLAGFLQFLPIVGPSVLVAGVAVLDLAVGELVRATVTGVAGLVLLGWLPDALVRPRLARRTADMPGSLYFVGFTGGLFTIGIVGVVAGPLVVAILSESVRMLAEEMDSGEQTGVTDFGPPVPAEDDAGPAGDDPETGADSSPNADAEARLDGEPDPDDPTAAGDSPPTEPGDTPG